MGTGNLRFEIIYGAEIVKHIAQVAEFRIRYFRDFPYLYEGNSTYEKKYLYGYAEDPKSILIKVTDANANLLAVSTALPLVTSSSILDGASIMFSVAGYNSEKIYYYGEVILDYSLRGKGVARKVYKIQDNFAIQNGFEKVAIATVVREDCDSRSPKGYRTTDPLWEKLGFKKTDITFGYNWPTILSSGVVEDTMNTMVYWVKNI